jgi:hypothetical protein
MSASMCLDVSVFDVGCTALICLDVSVCDMCHGTVPKGFLGYRYRIGSQEGIPRNDWICLKFCLGQEIGRYVSENCPGTANCPGTGITGGFSVNLELKWPKPCPK